MLLSGRFDILLLDHHLADGNGLDWLRSYHELGITVPTLFVMTKGDPQVAIEAMKEEVFDFLVKPFDLDQIEALIEKGLDRVC
jgi:DNA-binding NtrC family response regulator